MAQDQEPILSLSEFYFGLQSLPERIILAGWDVNVGLAAQPAARIGNNNTNTTPTSELRNILVMSLCRAIRSKLSWNDRHEVAVCTSDGTILTNFSRDVAVLDNAVSEMVDALLVNAGPDASAACGGLAPTQQDDQENDSDSDSKNNQKSYCEGPTVGDADQPFHAIATQLVGEQVLLQGECHQTSTHIVHVILVAIPSCHSSALAETKLVSGGSKQTCVRQRLLKNPLIFVDALGVSTSETSSATDVTNLLCTTLFTEEQRSTSGNESERGDEEERGLRFPYILAVCADESNSMAASAHRCAILAMSHPLQRPAQDSITT
jgi:hypothetical protein